MKISLKGINKVSKMLTNLSNSLDTMAKEIISELAKIGVVMAKSRFSSAKYDGDNDVNVDWVDMGTLMVQVRAYGNATLFIEFGSGVAHYDNYPNRPDNIDPIGGYGGKVSKGASGKHWGYYGDEPQNPTEDMINISERGVILTKGNQPARAMYLAETTMRDKIKQVAMEVARKYVRH